MEEEELRPNSEDEACLVEDTSPGPSLPKVWGAQHSSDCCVPRKISVLTQPILDVALKTACLFMVMSPNVDTQLKAPR